MIKMNIETLFNYCMREVPEMKQIILNSSEKVKKNKKKYYSNWKNKKVLNNERNK